jgi:hypothetical protein
MSRPHGCDVSATTRVRNIKNAPSFQDARKALVSTLENLSFLKVVTVQVAQHGAYTGEAVEVHFRDARDRPKLVFFDKFGRSRSLLKIGPISLAQAPLGFDHPTSVPTVGEILVGSLVPNTRKSHLDHVLRGWSSEAKPLYELLRILKFGTKSSEFECRSLLLQPSSSLLQSPDHLKAARDDIYMMARIILWGSIRPLQVLAHIQDPDRIKLQDEPTDIELTQARGIRISSKAIDYFDSITMKLADTVLSEAFMNGLTMAVVPMAPPQVQQQVQQQVPQYVLPAQGLGYGGGYGAGFGSTANGYSGGYGGGNGGGNGAAYDPSKMFAVRPSTPPIHDEPYAPRSPEHAYAPRSPEPDAYAPRSPVEPRSPIEAYAPSSPPYAPTSPEAYASSTEETVASQPAAAARPADVQQPSMPVVIRNEMASSLSNLYDDL